MREKSCAQLFSPIISSTMPKKKAVNSNRKGETIAHWGSPERRQFAQLVTDGTIDLDANPTSKVIDPLRKWFGNARSSLFARSIRLALQNIVSSETRQEEESEVSFQCTCLLTPS
jgi:hypothetical protein